MSTFEVSCDRFRRGEPVQLVKAPSAVEAAEKRAKQLAQENGCVSVGPRSSGYIEKLYVRRKGDVGGGWLVKIAVEVTYRLRGKQLLDMDGFPVT